MKKIFLVLFILVSSFLFFSLIKVEAQITPTPIQQSFQMPGVTCGDAESKDPNIQKCCLSGNLSLKDKIVVPEVFCVSDLLGSPVKAGCPGNVINGIVGYFFSAWPIKNIEEYYTGIAQKVNPCVTGNPSTLDYSNPSCVCKVALATTKVLCDKYLANSRDYGSCVTCADKGVWTSIGCVKNDLNSFIGETVFGTGIGLAGGLSLLCIIYAAFMMQSSEGNPEKLKKAQEMITSCIMGLMLIIFSVFILRLIGVNILKIPGFG